MQSGILPGIYAQQQVSAHQDVSADDARPCHGSCCFQDQNGPATGMRCSGRESSGSSTCGLRICRRQAGGCLRRESSRAQAVGGPTQPGERAALRLLTCQGLQAPHRIHFQGNEQVTADNFQWGLTHTFDHTGQSGRQGAIRADCSQGP